MRLEFGAVAILDQALCIVKRGSLRALHASGPRSSFWFDRHDFVGDREQARLMVPIPHPTSSTRLPM